MGLAEPALTIDEHVRQEDAPTGESRPGPDAEAALVDVELAVVHLPEKAGEDALGDPLVVPGCAALQRDDAFDVSMLPLLPFGSGQG